MSNETERLSVSTTNFPAHLDTHLKLTHINLSLSNPLLRAAIIVCTLMRKVSLLRTKLIAVCAPLHFSLAIFL